jgi:hypothetical protein
MFTRKKLEQKLNKEYKICITTVRLLPSGAIETIVNYQNLEDKKKYLLSAYDEKLRLKTMQDIILLDCIVISRYDVDMMKK